MRSASTHRSHRLALAASLWIALSIGSGCARAVAIESDRSALASIEVHNESGAAMIVSYDVAGAGRATLGAVPAGGSERFIITLPTGTAIRVFGTTEGGGRTSGPHEISLQAGTAQRVTLR